MRVLNKTILLTLIVICVLGLCVGCSDESELGKLKDKEILKAINSTCDKYFNEKEFVGMSVAIIKDGNVAYLNYGKTSVDVEKVTKNTIYEIASLSKPFAGSLLAFESLQGKVSLDDSVNKYADYLKSYEYKDSVMTLKHLATHSSGLPRMPRNWSSGPNPYKNYTKEKLITFLSKNTLHRKPGTLYEYSNLGFGLLGCILEDVEGCTYEDLLKKNIFDPLNMKSTAIYLSEQLQARKALPYLTGSTKGYEWDFDALKACAGIKSSTRDLARFIAANLGQIECDEELQKAFDLAKEVHFSGKQTIGLGWRLAKVKNKTIHEHDGLASGYTSYYALDIENGFGVVVLCNSADGVIDLGTSLMEMLMSEYGK
ncbi:beta-lactamase family protein [Clostridium sp. 'deep sea']|uniref:serine hydrolase domain-containing protein n=1 Tax=Clostridium sp. 'deep sea' TaxID=2779445 RepID=UPI00189642BA|nr:serine hydrolase domain-containing protein [Clostridium sp. 'deep sea']QOR36089.1 beta-lactamase family protein [Clostridium sp. 'deep sea']